MLVLKSISKTFRLPVSEEGSIMLKVFHMFTKKNVLTVEALKNINIEVCRGDFVGVIGHNGSGKSTLLKIMLGSFPPDNGGEVIRNGRIIRLALGIGFDNNMTGRENIYINGSMVGLSFRQIAEKFDEIVDFSSIREFIDTQVKFYSSGMKTRLAFSIAVHAEAEIVLLDEFFGGVGDDEFRERSNDVFKNQFLNRKTVVFVSHEINELRKYCNKILLLKNGEQIFYGPTEEGLNMYESFLN